MMSPTSLYTVRIRLNSGQVIQIVNVNIEALAKYKKAVWVYGVVVEKSPTTFEHICPLHINEVLYLQQDAAYESNKSNGIIIS